MSFATTDSVFLCKFDASTVLDVVSGSAPTITGGSLQIVDGVFDYAWQMQPTKYLSFSIGNVTSSLTFSFWLKPNNPGLGLVDDAVETIFQSVFDKTSGLSAVQSTDAYSVYEEVLENNQNQLVVVLRKTPTNYKYVSEPYDCDVFHHFWISYSGSSSVFKCFIDGVLDAGTSTGVLPSTLNTNSFPLKINANVPVLSTRRVRSSGVIDDLAIFSNYSIDQERISRAMNMGAIYLADDDLQDVEEISLGFVFDNPSTIKINSVLSSRGSVYLAQSNGIIKKGVRNIWKSRHDFHDSRELFSVNVVSKSDTLPVLENGVLTLRNEVIKI